MKKARKTLILVIAVCILLFSTVALAAEGDNGAIEAMNNLVDFLYGITRIIGSIMALFGIVQLGLSFSNHDPSQRVTGAMFILGGVIILFAKEIIVLIGG